MGINPQREIIPTLKNICQLFFDEESIYEISKMYLLKFWNRRTDGRAEGHAQSNMPFQLFQSWGHKNEKTISSRLVNLIQNARDTPVFVF